MTVETSESTGESIPIERKVGQLFHVGFSGTEPTPAVESLVRDRHVGGIIYFARNLRTPAQTRELTRSLQRIAGADEGELPLFVSVDQEGGTVRRLPYYPAVPGQMAVGATGDPDAAATAAEITAEQLRSVGVNFNLSPVLDVNSNPDNPVIGARSYGEEPETVAEFGARYVDGLQSAGAIACGKHFPGHGDTSTDSHAELPVVDADGDRIERVELPPFERAIEEGVDAIMAAHVAFPAITGSRTRPATLSRELLTGYLRERLGFDGLVTTDCMEMDAITDTVGTARGAVEAVKAGADAVFISHTPELQRRTIDAVVDAVETGEIPTERIDDAFERIRSLKRNRDLRPDHERPDTETNRETVRSISRRAVTLVRDRNDLIPLDAETPLAVLAARPTRGAPVEGETTPVAALASALEECGFPVSEIDLDPEESFDVEAVPAEARAVCCTADVARDPTQRDAVAELLAVGRDPVVVGVRSPYDLRHLPAVGTYLTTYDPAPANVVALTEVLAGDQPARGRVPPSLR